MTTLLEQKIDQFIADTGIAHALVHGPADGDGSSVQTERGSVPTIAKAVKDKLGFVWRIVVGSDQLIAGDSDNGVRMTQTGTITIPLGLGNALGQDAFMAVLELPIGGAMTLQAMPGVQLNGVDSASLTVLQSAQVNHIGVVQSGANEYRTIGVPSLVSNGFAQAAHQHVLTDISDTTLLSRNLAVISDLSAYRTALGLGSAATYNDGRYAQAGHTHLSADISDATSIGRGILSASTRKYVHDAGYFVVGDWSAIKAATGMVAGDVARLTSHTSASGVVTASDGDLVYTGAHWVPRSMFALKRIYGDSSANAIFTVAGDGNVQGKKFTSANASNYLVVPADFLQSGVCLIVDFIVVRTTATATGCGVDVRFGSLNSVSDSTVLKIWFASGTYQAQGRAFIRQIGDKVLSIQGIWQMNSATNIQIDVSFASARNVERYINFVTDAAVGNTFDIRAVEAWAL